MDWLDLLAVQGALKSLLKHHSSKASILQCSAFFMTAQMEAKKKKPMEVNAVRFPWDMLSKKTGEG